VRSWLFDFESQGFDEQREMEGDPNEPNTREDSYCGLVVNRLGKLSYSPIKYCTNFSAGDKSVVLVDRGTTEVLDLTNIDDPEWRQGPANGILDYAGAYAQVGNTFYGLGGYSRVRTNDSSRCNEIPFFQDNVGTNSDAIVRMDPDTLEWEELRVRLPRPLRWLTAFEVPDAAVPPC